MRSTQVAVDAMGGDYGPRVTVPAALQYLSAAPDVTLLLVGDQRAVSQHLGDIDPSVLRRVEILHSDFVVAMGDKPSSVLRGGSDSSMGLAIQAVKDGRAHACVSAGNTGALMALSRSILGTYEGIDRPAIITKIPTQKKHCQVLDLGANIQCEAQHLYQFAIMGSIVAQIVDNISAPRIALLNVGQEETKGSNQVREAARLIAADQRLNYVGFVEGDQIFSGEVDVIVCDGFVGNVALKTSEGLVKMAHAQLLEGFRRNLYSRLVGALAQPIIKRLAGQWDIMRYNGASLLGVQGTVIKSHGNANQASFEQAIERAIQETRSQLPRLINDNIAIH